VFIGRLVTTKGIRLLIEASKILRQQRRSFELLIVGDGPERTSLEALVREWQLTSQVRFLGRVPQSQIPEILAKADFVVIPSLGGEVFGMVVAENMLRGILVLASDLGAFVEVLGDTGLTFKTGDSNDLAHQIARLLDDPSLAKGMEQAAYRRVLKCFKMDRMIEVHAEIYRRLTSNKISST
jgi:phosphatidylinositol alpha-mannosyltransferase